MVALTADTYSFSAFAQVVASEDMGAGRAGWGTAGMHQGRTKAGGSWPPQGLKQGTVRTPAVNLFTQELLRRRRRDGDPSIW